jgi:hypothetical protein
MKGMFLDHVYKIFSGLSRSQKFCYFLIDNLDLNTVLRYTY